MRLHICFFFRLGQRVRCSVDRRVFENFTGAKSSWRCCGKYFQLLHAPSWFSYRHSKWQHILTNWISVYDVGSLTFGVWYPAGLPILKFTAIGWRSHIICLYKNGTSMKLLPGPWTILPSLLGSSYYWVWWPSFSTLKCCKFRTLIMLLRKRFYFSDCQS